MQADVVNSQKKFFQLTAFAHNPGMFSAFTTVLGIADCYEKNVVAGFTVDYTTKGAYYDPSVGPNWWIYYFEPIDVGDRTGVTLVTSINGHGHGFDFAVHTERDLSRERCNELIKKYIVIKPNIEEIVQDFVRKHFKTAEYVIGVHYRGTDKKRESPRAKYELMESHVRQVISMNGVPSAKIFVATDEQGFLDYMEKQFPNQIIVAEAIRSSDDSTPVHNTPGNKYQKGQQALVDCLLLSECNFLIRTSSNLSLCSTFFNVKLPVIEVTKRKGNN